MSATPPFLETLTRDFDPAALPGGQHRWLREARGAQLASLLRDGLPGARDEAWRYTSLRALERRAFAPADPDAASRELPDGLLPALLGGPRLVFVNGRFRADLSTLDALPAGLTVETLGAALAREDEATSERLRFLARRYDGSADAFARLNAVFAGDGALLAAAPDTRVEAPVELLFVAVGTGSDTAWHGRNLIELGAGASLTVVERHLSGGDGDVLGNLVSHVQLAASARLQHVRVQDCGGNGQLFARTDARIAAGAHYAPLMLELGGTLSRHELDADIAAPGAQLATRGAVVLSGRQHSDTRLSIRHQARDTRSDTLWRAIGDGRSRSAFHGGILISEGADGADAALSTKSLLLCDGAEIDAQPVLEIHADEVKASHGAAIGQLDRQALFYLRSRGIPEPAARAMLTYAFCREVIDVLDGPLREALAERIKARLPGLGAAP